MGKSSGPEHELKKPLYDVLSINGISDPEKVVDLVLSELNDYGIVDYAVKSPKLLSTAGRIIVAIALRPDITLSQIGIIAGINSATAAQNITALIKGNLIARTKLGRKNCYQINEEALAKHPDIIKLLRVLELVGLMGQETHGDSTEVNEDQGLSSVADDDDSDC